MPDIFYCSWYCQCFIVVAAQMSAPIDKLHKDSMTNSNELPAWFIFVYFLLPIPVAWLSLHLMSLYSIYYDIGINAVANNGFLIYIVAPILLISLYIASVIFLYLTKRRVKSRWQRAILCCLLVIFVGLSSFAIKVRTVSDYPTEEPQNMSMFLNFYANEAFRHLSWTPSSDP